MMHHVALMYVTNPPAPSPLFYVLVVEMREVQAGHCPRQSLHGGYGVSTLWEVVPYEGEAEKFACFVAL